MKLDPSIIFLPGKYGTSSSRLMASSFTSSFLSLSLIPRAAFLAFSSLALRPLQGPLHFFLQMHFFFFAFLEGSSPFWASSRALFLASSASFAAFSFSSLSSSTLSKKSNHWSSSHPSFSPSSSRASGSRSILKSEPIFSLASVLTSSSRLSLSNMISKEFYILILTLD